MLPRMRATRTPGSRLGSRGAAGLDAAGVLLRPEAASGLRVPVRVVRGDDGGDLEAPTKADSDSVSVFASGCKLQGSGGSEIAKRGLGLEAWSQVFPET